MTTKPINISSVHELYGAGVGGQLLQGQYDTERVYDWLEKRHRKAIPYIDDDHIYRRGKHEWHVPLGVREALKAPLTWSQIANKYPWYVTWRSPTSGRRLKKYQMSLPAAIQFIATKVQYVDPQASVVSRHGYDIPPSLRNKLPRPWKWCPLCMTARKFYRVYPEQSFSAIIRHPETEKFIERSLPLMQCKVCGCTNRDNKFRRSNQKWVTRRFKRGVIRARRSSPLLRRR